MAFKEFLGGAVAGGFTLVLSNSYVISTISKACSEDLSCLATANATALLVAALIGIGTGVVIGVKSQFLK